MVADTLGSQHCFFYFSFSGPSVCKASSLQRGRQRAHGEGESHIEGVVVLRQRCVSVVQHQLLQAVVQVVGLGEAIAARRAVDDAVLHLAVRPEGRRTPVTVGAYGDTAG